MRNRTPNFASHMRKAFSSMVLNTGCRSPGELDMTRSTSSVAACRSKASLSWRCACASGRSRSVALSCTIAAAPARRKRVEILRDARKPLNGLDFAVLFDHFVGAGEQRRRHGKAEHSCGRQDDDQFDLARLHDRQARRLRALENSTGIYAGLTIRIRHAGSIAHQPADIGKLAL